MEEVLGNGGYQMVPVLSGCGGKEAERGRERMRRGGGMERKKKRSHLARNVHNMLKHSTYMYSEYTRRAPASPLTFSLLSSH